MSIFVSNISTSQRTLNPSFNGAVKPEDYDYLIKTPYQESTNDSDPANYGYLPFKNYNDYDFFCLRTKLLDSLPEFLPNPTYTELKIYEDNAMHVYLRIFSNGVSLYNIAEDTLSSGKVSESSSSNNKVSQMKNIRNKIQVKVNLFTGKNAKDCLLFTPIKILDRGDYFQVHYLSNSIQGKSYSGESMEQEREYKVIPKEYTREILPFLRLDWQSKPYIKNGKIYINLFDLDELTEGQITFTELYNDYNIKIKDKIIEMYNEGYIVGLRDSIVKNWNLETAGKMYKIKWETQIFLPPSMTRVEFIRHVSNVSDMTDQESPDINIYFKTGSNIETLYSFPNGHINLSDEAKEKRKKISILLNKEYPTLSKKGNFVIGPDGEDMLMVKVNNFDDAMKVGGLVKPVRNWT